MQLHELGFDCSADDASRAIAQSESPSGGALRLGVSRAPSLPDGLWGLAAARRSVRSDPEDRAVPAVAVEGAVRIGQLAGLRERAARRSGPLVAAADQADAQSLSAQARPRLQPLPLPQMGLADGQSLRTRAQAQSRTGCPQRSPRRSADARRRPRGRSLARSRRPARGLRRANGAKGCSSGVLRDAAARSRLATRRAPGQELEPRAAFAARRGIGVAARGEEARHRPCTAANETRRAPARASSSSARAEELQTAPAQSRPRAHGSLAALGAPWARSNRGARPQASGPLFWRAQERARWRRADRSERLRGCGIERRGRSVSHETEKKGSGALESLWRSSLARRKGGGRAVRLARAGAHAAAASRGRTSRGSGARSARGRLASSSKRRSAGSAARRSRRPRVWGCEHCGGCAVLRERLSAREGRGVLASPRSLCQRGASSGGGRGGPAAAAKQGCAVALFPVGPRRHT